MNRIARLARIIRVCWKYRLDTFLENDALPGFWRSATRLPPLRWLPVPTESRAVRLRRSLEELGPIFIKFGQLLSTRQRSAAHPIIADALALLQDQVAHFDRRSQGTLIDRAALGHPLEQSFSAFDEHPAGIRLDGAGAYRTTVRRLAGSRSESDTPRHRPDTIRRRPGPALHNCRAGWHPHHPDGKRLRPREVVRDYEHRDLR
jgi:ubiquinone biosynthesis protein